MNRDKGIIKSISTILLVLCLNLASPKACASLPDSIPKYHVETFDEINGLFQNQITAMVADPKGYLWIATNAGVQRFDGERFYEPPFDPELAGYPCRITMLYKGNGDSLLAYSTDEKMFIVTKGQVYKATSRMINSFGILCLNSVNIKPKAAIDARLKKSIYPTSHTIGLQIPRGWQVNADTFIITTQSGISLCNTKGIYKQIEIEAMNEKQVLYVGRSILYLNAKKELQHYDLTGRLAEVIPVQKGRKHVLICPGTESTTNGYLCQDSLLYRISMVNDKVAFHLLLTNFQSAAIPITIFEKDEHTIAVATSYKGLQLYKKMLFSVVGADRSGSNGYFRCQLLLTDRQTIIAGGNRMFRKGKYVGALKEFRNTAFCFLQDKAGTYWFQNYDTLLRVKGANAVPVFSKIFHHPVLGLYEDKLGQVWFSDNEGNIWRYKNALLRQYTMLPRFQTLPKYNVECIGEDKAGNILIGTTNGICRFFRRGEDYFMPDSLMLPGLDVRFINTDKEGNTWIATYGGGMFLLQNDKVVRLPLDGNRKLQYAHALIEDGRSRFWIPTDNGLFLVNKQAILDFTNGGEVPYYRRFDKNEGFATNEFNGAVPSCLWLFDSLLSLPTVNGLVQFHPNDIATQPDSKAILLDYIKVDTALILVNDHFTLPAGLHNISAHISSLSWGGDGNQSLRYQLVRAGEIPDPVSWQQVGSSGMIRLSGLSAGSYQLIVRKRGINMVHATNLIIHFAILPPWYLTWWALVLWVLAGAGISTFFLLFRFHTIRKNDRFDKLLLQEQLKTLRVKLDPHMIQNTFNILGHRIANGQSDEALRSISDISHYLRSLLMQSDKAVLSIEEELEVAREYLNMMRKVHIHAFKYKVDLDADVDAFGTLVPALLLQPFLENAIKYGLHHRDERLNVITISIKQSGAYILFTITDPGEGLVKKDGHLAIGNTLSFQRLEKLYAKNKYRPQLVFGKTESGFKVEISIPLE